MEEPIKRWCCSRRTAAWRALLAARGGGAAGGRAHLWKTGGCSVGVAQSGGEERAQGEQRQRHTRGERATSRRREEGLQDNRSRAARAKQVLSVPSSSELVFVWKREREKLSLTVFTE